MASCQGTQFCHLDTTHHTHQHCFRPVSSACPVRSTRPRIISYQLHNPFSAVIRRPCCHTQPLISYGRRPIPRKMAQKAKKDRARSNTTALNNLHIGTAIVNTIFVLFHSLLRSRSLLAYVLLSAPSFVCEYVLEVSGRPKYDPTTKALKTAGEDLAAEGLTEYMFDVIWVTWASIVAVMLFGNWGWLLWLSVPAYGVWLGYGLLGMGKQKLAQMQQSDEPAPQGNRRSRRAA